MQSQNIRIKATWSPGGHAMRGMVVPKVTSAFVNERTASLHFDILTAEPVLLVSRWQDVCLHPELSVDGTFYGYSVVIGPHRSLAHPHCQPITHNRAGALERLAARTPRQEWRS